MAKPGLKFKFNAALAYLGLFSLALLFASANAHAFCAGTLIKEIKAIAAKPEIIEAVKTSNARRLSKEQVIALDEKWIKLHGQLPEADQIKNSKTSALLASEVNRQSYFKEAILPDSHISRTRWDDSTQAMIAQVSVPVYDGDNMIGVLTVGVDLKRVPHPNH